MADSKHTPGPWWFRTAANGDNGISAPNTGVFAEAFAEIRHSGENARDEALANARLIAAAPDLLIALKELTEEAFRNMVGGKGHLIDDAWSAIAKAEGRS